MTRSNTKCTACQSTGTVLDADHNKRPCSRCRADDFSHWYDIRLAQYRIAKRKACDAEAPQPK